MNPQALQLRFLRTLTEIAAERNGSFPPFAWIFQGERFAADELVQEPGQIFESGRRKLGDPIPKLRPEIKNRVGRRFWKEAPPL